MCRDLPEAAESVYAREGTQFHTLCWVTAGHELLGTSEIEYLEGMLEWAEDTEDEWKEDQLGYVNEWLKFLRSALEEDPNAVVLLEQRVETGVPGCWGTADVVIISPDQGWMRVIDIKYGAGIWVDAHKNSQLMLYGVGALSLVEDPLLIHDITLTVWQPRKNNISDYVISRTELVKWRDSIIPTAKLALGEDAPFGPSESACRFCPAAGFCAPRTRHILAQDFGDPDALTGEELAEAYERTSELKRWAADIEDAALKKAYEDAGSIPGFKVVRSGGRRGINNDAEAIKRLVKAGYDEDLISVRKPVTLGTLDKVVGDELQHILDGVLVKSEGRLSLARDSDPRPPADAVHSAQEDFAEITNERNA
jgi:hypothetical protein